MDNEVVLPAAVAQKEEAKPVVPKVKKASKPKSAAKKPLQRRAFPYQQVLKMWKAGKTLEKIARAVGRFQKDADDPLHGFRVSLIRFHKGVKINGRLVKLPHRVSRKTLKLAVKAGKKAAA